VQEGGEAALGHVIEDEQLLPFWPQVVCPERQQGGGSPGRGGRRGPASAHAGEGWPGIHARPRGRGRWRTGPMQGGVGGRRAGDEVVAARTGAG